ncbi:MAG: hypothetical protein ACTMIR_05865 [Cellulomonadaceae bacterium]
MSCSCTCEPAGCAGTAPQAATTCARAAGRKFLELADAHGVYATTHAYPLSRAPDALQDLKVGRFDGAAVLVNDA